MMFSSRIREKMKKARFIDCVAFVASAIVWLTRSKILRMNSKLDPIVRLNGRPRSPLVENAVLHRLYTFRRSPRSPDRLANRLRVAVRGGTGPGAEVLWSIRQDAREVA